jgi:hypothetical protein
VRFVFQWYLYGEDKAAPLSIRAIARKLGATNIQTRGDREAHVSKKGSRGEWSGAMVRHILTNETYTGTWHFGKTRMLDEAALRSLGDDKRLATLASTDRKTRLQRSTNGKASIDKIQTPVPHDEWIAVSVPAIIDGRTFKAAQKRLTLNKEQATRNVRHEYLLGRRLKCAWCGYSLVGRTRREKHQYYVCKGCEKKPVAMNSHCRLAGLPAVVCAFMHRPSFVFSVKCCPLRSIIATSVPTSRAPPNSTWPDN